MSGTMERELAEQILARGARAIGRAVWEVEALGFSVIEKGRDCYVRPSFALTLADGYLPAGDEGDEILERSVMESSLPCDCSFEEAKIEECPRCRAADFVMSAWLAFEKGRTDENDDTGGSQKEGSP